MWTDIAVLVFGAILVNNFVFTYFLGICPYLGVTDKLSASVGLGAATTFVMAVAAPVTWLVNNLLLARYELHFLQNVSFILVISVLVQLVEMFVRRTSPVLYRALGIFLPLITTNCAILFLALMISMRQLTLTESVFFGFGSGIGFLFALVIMAGIREQLSLVEVPAAVRGACLTLVVAGLIALSFMGFAGIV